MPIPDNGDMTGWLLAGIAFGLYWFFKGFMILRKYRVVADTPEIPIRSAAMGLVEVHGKACGDELIESPVGGTPCLYSSVQAGGADLAL
jgi:hypothetical protein